MQHSSSLTEGVGHMTFFYDYALLSGYEHVQIYAEFREGQCCENGRE